MAKQVKISKGRAEALGLDEVLAKAREELSLNNVLFLHEYARTGNQTRAYMTAYATTNYQSAAKSASTLVKNVKIKKYFDLLSQMVETKIIEETTDTRLKIIEELNEFISMTRQNMTILGLGMADELSERDFEGRKHVTKTPALLNAYELLAKLTGALDDDSKNNGTIEMQKALDAIKKQLDVD